MSPPAPGTVVREPFIEPTSAGGRAIPMVVHPGWRLRFPWLLQGTTGRGQDEPFDLGLAGSQPVASALARWWTLRQTLDVGATVLARQVHGRAILAHDAMPDGLHLAPPADGHRTSSPGLLLTVTVADCVPVSIVAPRTRTVVLLHAGWRGVAAGILEAGIAAACGADASAEELHAHFGPSICGACYEVGPEVHEALALAVPAAPAPVDLRAGLARRAASAGIPEAAISRSAWCTRCDAPRFFSHRGGDAGRQVGVLGIRAGTDP